MLDYLEGPNVIMRVLKAEERGRREASKMEEGAVSQETWKWILPYSQQREHSPANILTVAQ